MKTGAFFSLFRLHVYRDRVGGEGGFLENTIRISLPKGTPLGFGEICVDLRKTADTRQRGSDKLCAQVVAAATATGSQSICGGLWAHLARSLCHTTPSRCLCPENPSPGHTKRQITMIAGASRGEWLRGPMHFGFGVLGTHKKSAGRLSPDEVAPSSRKVNPHIFARDRTPRTARGLTPP